MATVARDSVFGQSTKNTRSGAEPPAGGTPGEGTVDSPYDPGNVPEQIPTEPGTEPPSGGPPGRGTADAPYDRGNEPEQIQVCGNPASAAADTHPLPSSSIPASKIDNPDPSSSSEMKSALAAHEAENTANKASPNASRKTESESKKANAVNPTSHSALFGLGKKEEGVHPPKDSREVSGTIEEAGQVMGQQAEMERRGASEDDTGGYLGLRKAAMEEEERKRNGGADGRGGATTTTTAAAAEENRDARSMEHKNSLGREISPGELPDGTHRRSIAEGMPQVPQGHHFGRKNTGASSEKSGGFRERLKDKFRSKK